MRHAPRHATGRAGLLAIAASLALLAAACGDQAPGDEVIEIDPDDEATEEPAEDDVADDEEVTDDEATEEPAEDQATEDEATDEEDAAGDDDLRAEVELEVPAEEGSEDTETVTYTVVCGASASIEDTDDPAGWVDEEPSVEASDACEAAEALLADPPEQDPEAACTQVYGGPHTATVTVTHGDQEVAVDFGRTNGCEIGTWDEYEALLGEADMFGGVEG